MKEKFAVSLMCMDFLKVGEQLNILNDWVGMYHVDIMDGHYCKNITLSPDLVKSFKKVSKLPLDVHLMTTNPEDWIDPVAEAGADCVVMGRAVWGAEDPAKAWKEMETLNGYGTDSKAFRNI